MSSVRYIKKAGETRKCLGEIDTNIIQPDKKITQTKNVSLHPTKRSLNVQNGNLNAPRVPIYQRGKQKVQSKSHLNSQISQGKGKCKENINNKENLNDSILNNEIKENIETVVKLENEFPNNNNTQCNEITTEALSHHNAEQINPKNEINATENSKVVTAGNEWIDNPTTVATACFSPPSVAPQPPSATTPETLASLFAIASPGCGTVPSDKTLILPAPCTPLAYTLPDTPPASERVIKLEEDAEAGSAKNRSTPAVPISKRNARERNRVRQVSSANIRWN